MDGIILFADDQVFETESNEYKLFCKFNSDSNISILPIDNIEVVEKTILSVSTFRALILDWNFKRQLDNEDDDIVISDYTPFDILKKIQIYSIIYVYSQNAIPDTAKTELEELFPGKIFFEQKSNTQDTDSEYDKILGKIKQFEENNKHMQIPFIWSQTINTSVQKIFVELESADPNWIKEIYNTAKNDGAEPNMEVINIFHNLINELVIQNDKLLNSLSQYVEHNNTTQNNENSLAKLYNRIYYTKLLPNAPLTTGDIFKFGDEYGILFTPECDVNAKRNFALDFLLFKKEQFDSFLQNKKQYSKDQFQTMIAKEKQKRDLLGQFNNGNIAYHILPSFPFNNNEYNLSAYIDFENTFCVKLKDEYEGKRIEYKLNSPYIYQLRQRYLAYMGRVGVLAIPESLKLFNLK